MSDFFKVTGIIISLAIIIVGLAFGLPYLKLQVLKMYGQQYESVKTDIYRENKSYVEGTVRDLREMRVEYEKANDTHKDALKSLILHRANELNWERLPLDLKDFLKGLQND